VAFYSVNCEGSLPAFNAVSSFLCQEEKELFEDISKEELESGLLGEGLGCIGFINGVPKLPGTLGSDIRKAEYWLFLSLSYSVCDMFTQPLSELSNPFWIEFQSLVAEEGIDIFY
jgi:hypothetical protein